MSEDQPWKNVYYKSESSFAPVKDFISKESTDVRNKLFKALERLKELNTSLGEPHAKKVTGRDFWELLVWVDKEIYRIFYFAAAGRKFVLLHAIHKKTMKTPKKDLDLAEDRMKDYSRRVRKSKSNK